MSEQSQNEVGPEKASNWRRNVETLSHAAQALAVMVAVATLIAALFQSKAQEKYDKEAAAYRTWEEYFSYSIENPQLASAKGAFDQDGNLNAKYIWFVERMLIAAEQVIRADPDDPQWQDSIRYEVKSHYRYILSEDFLNNDGPRMSSFCTYEKRVRLLVVSTFADPKLAEEIAEEEGPVGSPNFQKALFFVQEGMANLKRTDLDCTKILTSRGSPDA